jgi:hypothetical protein
VPPPAKGGFLTSLDALAPPFSAYGEIWPALNRLPEPDVAEITALVKARLGGWAAYRILAASPDAAKALQQVWESYIALNILAGWRHDELAGLTHLLVTHHVLACALAVVDPQSSPPPPTPTSETVAAWIKATLVLPDEIFGQPDAPQSSTPATSWVRPYSYGLAHSIHFSPGGYLKGEVQRIENVLQGELRETRHRSLSRHETKTGRKSEPNAMRAGLKTPLWPILRIRCKRRWPIMCRQRM